MPEEKKEEKLPEEKQHDEEIKIEDEEKKEGDQPEWATNLTNSINRLITVLTPQEQPAANQPKEIEVPQPQEVEQPEIVEQEQTEQEKPAKKKSFLDFLL